MSIRHIQRLLHWSLALSVAAIFFVFVDGDWPHRFTGYVAASVVLIRLVLSLTSAQLLSVKELNPFKKSLMKAVQRSIWLSVMLLGLSGWMMGLDAFWGEEWLENAHHRLSDFLMLMVVLHLAGLLTDALILRRRNWRLMFPIWSDDPDLDLSGS